MMLTEAGRGWDFNEVHIYPANTEASLDIYNYIMNEEFNTVENLQNGEGGEMGALELSGLIQEKIKRYFNNLRRRKAKENTGIEEAAKTALVTKNRRRTRKHYVSTDNSSGFVKLLPLCFDRNLNAEGNTLKTILKQCRKR